MHYFIDGYNLMFRLSMMNDSLQAEREQFISNLYAKIQVVGLDVTIVFDAQHQEGLGSRTHLDFLEICFTDEGETADDYIIRELSSVPNPREEIVVTSDNKLAWLARRMHAKSEQVETFVRWLDHRYRKRKKELPKDFVIKEPPKISLPEELPVSQEKNTADSYYLNTFEKKFKELEPERSLPKPKKKTSSKKAGESEMERWQRLFENRDLDEDTPNVL
ncbi:putative uncharacterized protein [Waddlia chondrophila 2032/99]|uniref:YacP-like NYN domain protein n=1 Tax=Waddlia chondrophila 2032/99 TaxID=765953 RepID=F8LBA8_9BACT|nr:putative uncharacterized protein [Waddlia chondrophila 2032/99]